MVSHAPAKRLPLSTTLGYAGFVCLLVCFLWAPSFLSLALENQEIKNHAVRVMGKVAGHRSWIRKQTRHYSASIEYVVNGKAFSVVIQGDGASEKRLPLGTAVEVRYLPRRPALAEASTTDASTYRSSLLPVIGMCALPFLLFLASYLTRSRKSRVVPLTTG